jgi:hypothetical protein
MLYSNDSGNSFPVKYFTDNIDYYKPHPHDQLYEWRMEEDVVLVVTIIDIQTSKTDSQIFVAGFRDFLLEKDKI